MSFDVELDRLIAPLEAVGSAPPDGRFRTQIDLGVRLARACSERQHRFEQVLLEAAAAYRAAVDAGASAAAATVEAERLLAPIGEVAKRYRLHCVGHAHIDLNWTWNWPETVAICNDTFTTVDRLMDEYPEFTFAQSQAAIYELCRVYTPALYARIRERIRQRRWEVIASQWVEGDKNLASGESLCRHLLLTRRFVQEQFHLPYDAVGIAWELDDFGHAGTIPMVLASGGVRWYYLLRGGKGPQLFWWQSPDGSRVLAYDDSFIWYRSPDWATRLKWMLQFEQQTGLADYLYVYGVGDHGGGPTRRQLDDLIDKRDWPVFPRIEFSTTRAFFEVAEREARNLPVIQAELNPIFDGCYTSESRIKRANRRSENGLVEAEVCAVLAGGLAGCEYPAAALGTAWRQALLNQFHDILPGSGVAETYEYSLGLFQQIMAQTTMVKTTSLRAIAARVDTASLCGCQAASAGLGLGIGGGPGDVPETGVISRRGAGGACCDPFVVFNPTPWTRDEVVTARLWNREWRSEQIAVRDDAGRTTPVQVRGHGHALGHAYTDVAFPTDAVGGFGYRAFSVHRHVARAEAARAVAAGAVTAVGSVMENACLRAVIDPRSGAVSSLIDKRSGIELVPAGERLGRLDYLREAPHPMTAWVIGQIVEERRLIEGATIETVCSGPYLAALRSTRRLNDSRLTLTVSLTADATRLDFELEADWLERGSPEIGVPVLRAAFPLALEQTVATFETPFGHAVRPGSGGETSALPWAASTGRPAAGGDVPALQWADLTGRPAGGQGRIGVTLANDSKYGHSASESALGLTLIRSSYDPDPLPELGRHVIRWSVTPHDGNWMPADAVRAGAERNLPLNVVGTDVHAGTLPGAQSFVEVLTSNVVLAALKRAEDSDALVVRLYEANGVETEARIRLSAALATPDARAVVTDTLEQPLPDRGARLEDGVLVVRVPAFGIATVLIG